MSKENEEVETLVEAMDYFLPINLVQQRDITLKALNEEGEVDDIELTLDMTWAKGMLGVMPLFRTLEAAKEYAGEAAEVLVFSGPMIKGFEDEQETDKIDG